jgi:hypothetical protein
VRDLVRKALMSQNPDDREKLRERVAAEHKFQLYKRYSERQAADRIGLDYSTLKRKRRGGLVPFVDMGGGSVAYLGYHIADIILFGVGALDEEIAPAGGPLARRENDGESQSREISEVGVELGIERPTVLVFDRQRNHNTRFLPEGCLTRRLQHLKPPRQAAASKSTTF